MDGANGVGEVWLSGFVFAKDLEKLTENKIGAVCSTYDLKYFYPANDKEEINHQIFKMRDSEDQNISRFLSPTFSFIE